MIEEFPEEYIPDENHLFYRVHKQFIIDGEIIPGAFQSKVDGMSTDWDKYITPESALNLSKIPNDNAIVKFVVGSIRQESVMEVIHNPQNYNRAHSLVTEIPDKGELKTKARLILKRLNEIVININSN